MTQGVQKQIGILPAIEAETHLFQIGGKMLCADVMQCSHDAAFQERERIFDRIGIDVVFHVYLSAVLDLLVGHVGTEFDDCSHVGWEFVGNDDIGSLADILSDVLRQRSRLHTPGAEEPKGSLRLPDANYDLSSARGPGPPQNFRSPNRSSATEALTNITPACGDATPRSRKC